jgi:glycolate oxidase FAD binding subunit
MTDPALQALSARIRAAGEAGTALRVRGGGTKDFYGGALEGEVLDTQVYAGIVDYEPSELVITARAGTSLAAVESAMRARGQMLGFEPPRFAAGGTLGGAVACGLSGPRRPYAGAVRDFLLGIKVIDGTGEHLSFGGRVMKNVAGFDASRLMAGALGTLGVITEVSLKCLPLPRVEASVTFDCGADEAIRRVNEWGREPLPISATCFCEGTLAVRLSGAQPAVQAAIEKLAGRVMPGADAFWLGVRDHAHPFFVKADRERNTLWRLSVRSTAPYTDLGGDQLVEWGGALRWLAADERASPARIRVWAAAQGGHATQFRGAPERTPDVFHPLDPALAGVHRRLQAVFDPLRVFNRNRLLPS